MADGTDGRVARGERTREAIIHAHAALLREGVLKPTGKLIAERAGVSLRTVWLNFNDVEALLTETTRYWSQADAALRTDIDPELPVDQRIDLFCAMRVRRLEHLAPAARSAALGEPFSAVLAASRQEQVARVTGDVDEVFAAELTAAGDRRAVLAAELFVAASWPAWSSLRGDLGLDVPAAAAVMRDTMARLLRT